MPGSTATKCRQGDTAGVLPTVEIVITTRNRYAELRRALASCVSQDYPALTITVFDDRSDDGTVGMTKAEFPNVAVHVSEDQVGYIALRNKAYSSTNASYILSLDDDAWLTDRSTVSVLVDQMKQDPTVAALAVPYLETTPAARKQLEKMPAPGSELRSYVGTAHFSRVSAVLQLRGYRALLVHQGEERDLSIRLRAAGWRVRLAAAPPIVHAVSTVRDRRRMYRYSVRNQLLYDFFYTPWFAFPFIALRHVARLCIYCRSVEWAMRTIWYAFSAITDCWKYREYRSPLTLAAYRSHMLLPTHGPQYVERSEFPPPCGLAP